MFEPHSNTTKALARLRSEIASGRPTPSHPEALKTSEIKREVSVFQPRQLAGNLIEDERHTANLVEAIGNPAKANSLDRILVWWGGENWYVIDGHHRLLAYRNAGIELPVPVKVFEGTLEDAMTQTAIENSKDKLPMTRTDKGNMAWRLTVHCPSKSKREVMAACGVSHGNVADMRRALKALRSLGETDDT
jgi:hypothetical protein